MPILHLIRKPLSILRTACSSVFQLAASDRETSSFRPDQQQASDQAFWPSLANKEESITIVLKVEPEMAATNADASALTSRTLTLRNTIGSVANSVAIFQRNNTLPSEHPNFDRAYTWSFILLCFLAATIIATKQIEQRNKTANYLDQRITTELILDGQYTCSCTLPQSLLALQKTPIQAVSNHGLRRCYNKDDLATITVVQFNKDTAYDVAKTVESFNASVNISYASNEKGWVFLEQEATELVLWTGTDNRTLSSICNGVPYLDTVFTKALNDSNLPVYFDYPLSYMRMAIEYNCSDCKVCSPNAIMSALNKSNASFLVPLDQWVECSGFGMDTNPRNPCNATQSYHGRCNLYPTFDISMSSRLEDVIDTLESMNSTLNITTRTSKGQNGIEMHANVLYYNHSKVVETNNVTYGYFLIDTTTDRIWPILLASYPNIVGSCLNMDTFHVSVCNGTSICNVYKKLENGVSTAALNCIDFSKDYDSCLLMANASGNENIRDQLCERNSPSCQNVLPYQVKYPVPDLARTPPDNMSVSIIMNNSWLQTYINGVCSRMYADVVPYTLGGRSVFLETNCTSQDLCTITGNYNAVNDTPDMLQPRPVDGPDRENLESSLTPNYVCYKLTKEPWFTFAITLFGTIGGWLTTMYTVANMFYSSAHDRWHEWRTRRSGGRVGPAAATDDSRNDGDQSNAGSDAPLGESTSSRQDLIVAGESPSTETLELARVETVEEQTIQPGATTSSGNPVMRQRSIARPVSEKEVTGLPQL
ncbi:unnamed protein product [Sphagnum compactum]